MLVRTTADAATQGSLNIWLHCRTSINNSCFFFPLLFWAPSLLLSKNSFFLYQGATLVIFCVSVSTKVCYCPLFKSWLDRITKVDIRVIFCRVSSLFYFSLFHHHYCYHFYVIKDRVKVVLPLSGIAKLFIAMLISKEFT